VLIGYGVVVVSLCRTVIDLFSRLDWSTQLPLGQRMGNRLGFGTDVMFIVLMLGLLAGVWFVLWVATTSTESTEQSDLAKVVSLVFAIQSALFAIGTLVNIVRAATLDFPHVTHPGFGSFGWTYPVPAGLLLAAFGYLRVWRALGARSLDTSGTSPADGHVEIEPDGHAVDI
jgi:hypothetical protein